MNLIWKKDTTHNIKNKNILLIIMASNVKSAISVCVKLNKNLLTRIAKRNSKTTMILLILIKNVIIKKNPAIKFIM